MTDDLYRKLQQHIDRMPVPFPATKSGVEIRILKHLFTPEDARVALALGMLPEPVSAIRRRLRSQLSNEALATQLKDMARRGIVMEMPGPRGPRYAKAVFVVGFYEAQVNRLTAAFEHDVHEYFEEAFGQALVSQRTRQMRTVPVNRVIPIPDREVARYDDIASIVRTSNGPFAVLNCICQQGGDVTAKPCRQTTDREHCLMFGPAATLMVERAGARFVSREEMLELLQRADDHGLVLQPQNTENPLFVCCCCGCCCGVLTTAKRFPKPAQYFSTNYAAHVDADRCQACGTCASRCQMDAVAVDAAAKSSVVDGDRCIGCGLCVPTCPSEAIALRHLEGERVPPKDTGRLYVQMFRERFGPLGVAAVLARKMVGLRT